MKKGKRRDSPLQSQFKKSESRKEGGRGWEDWAGLIQGGSGGGDVNKFSQRGLVGRWRKNRQVQRWVGGKRESSLQLLITQLKGEKSNTLLRRQEEEHWQ